MRRAHKRDAATEGKFFFRSNIDDVQAPPRSHGFGSPGDDSDEAAEIYSPCENDPQGGLEEMTVQQILEGRVGWVGFGCVVRCG